MRVPTTVHKKIEKEHLEDEIEMDTEDEPISPDDININIDQTKLPANKKFTKGETIVRQVVNIKITKNQPPTMCVLQVTCYYSFSFPPH